MRTNNSGTSRTISFNLTRIIRYIGIIALLLLIGCAGGMPYEYTHSKATLIGAAGQAAEVTRQFTAGYEQVWSATIAVIQEMGHPITTIDESTGTLTTDWLLRGGAPFLLGIPLNHFQDRYSVRITESAEGTVRVGIRRSIQTRRKGGEYLPKTSDGEIEQWMLDQIAARVAP